MNITPEIAELAARIKLLVMDCDGVLTDGRLYFSNEGEAMKAFHVHDGQGIVSWHRAGYVSAVVTARASKILERRAAELGIAHVFQGAGAKDEVLRKLCGELGIGLDEAVFVGDDIADVEAMKIVGLPIAVANARPEAIEAATLVTSKNGGEGAIREVVEMLLLGASVKG